MNIGRFMERYGYKILTVLFVSIVARIISVPFLILFWGFSDYAPIAGVITIVAFIVGMAFIMVPKEWRSEIMTRTFFRTYNEVHYDKNEKKRGQPFRKFFDFYRHFSEGRVLTSTAKRLRWSLWKRLRLILLIQRNSRSGNARKSFSWATRP